MNRKFFIVVNPKAGREKVEKITQGLTSFLDAKSCEFNLFETKADKRGTPTVRENLDDTYTDLVIIGGDGTINEAINGLDYDIPVSFVPSGSGDDFVKMIDIGNNTIENFDTLLNGKPKRIDLGICNGRKFINGVGVGFDGQIVADMLNRKVPLLSGHAKYYYHVLQILSSYRFRKYNLSVDGGPFEEKDLILLTVANGTTFGGGFKLTPEAKIDDGVLDICTVGNISALKRYINILRLKKGTHGVLKEIDHYKVESLSIEENDLLEGHIDGEYLGRPPFEISILPSSLTIRTKS